MFLESCKSSCPYCGEKIDFLFEPLDSSQEYFEDCPVCCQPILVKISPCSDTAEAQFHCFRADEVS